MKGKKNKALKAEGRVVEKLFLEVRNAAVKTVEDLWSAISEEDDLDKVQAADTALHLLTDCGAHDKAMKLLEVMYALTEQEPSKEFTACQEYPALSQMFMDEFLVESAQFIFEAGMEEVIDFVLNEGDEGE